jgi:hypothetical protein
MEDIAKGIAISVGAAVVLGALAWASGFGRTFWNTLGTFELARPGPVDPPSRIINVSGVRTLFVLTVLALAMGLGALIAFAFRSSGHISANDIYLGDPTPAIVSKYTPAWAADPKCPSDSKAIGFYCFVQSGGGNLQNLGIPPSGIAHCLWKDVTGGDKGVSFAAVGQALCVRVSNQ